MSFFLNLKVKKKLKRKSLPLFYSLSTVKNLRLIKKKMMEINKQALKLYQKDYTIQIPSPILHETTLSSYISFLHMCDASSQLPLKMFSFSILQLLHSLSELRSIEGIKMEAVVRSETSLKGSHLQLDLSIVYNTLFLFFVSLMPNLQIKKKLYFVDLKSFICT